MQSPDVPSGLTLDGRSVSRTVGMASGRGPSRSLVRLVLALMLSWPLQRGW